MTNSLIPVDSSYHVLEHLEHQLHSLYADAIKPHNLNILEMPNSSTVLTTKN